MARILLIDDTPEIAELLTYSLRDLGHEVHAEGYTTAVNELIDTYHADAVVLDCTAYDMSEALFDAIRQNPDHKAIAIIVISDTPEVADQSLNKRKAARVLLVPKPFSGSQVGRALAQLLQ